MLVCSRCTVCIAGAVANRTFRTGSSTRSRDSESVTLRVGVPPAVAAVSVTGVEGSVAASRKSPSGTLRGTVAATGASVDGFLDAVVGVASEEWVGWLSVGRCVRESVSLIPTVLGVS